MRWPAVTANSRCLLWKLRVVRLKTFSSIPIKRPTATIPRRRITHAKSTFDEHNCTYPCYDTLTTQPVGGRHCVSSEPCLGNGEVRWCGEGRVRSVGPQCVSISADTDGNKTVDNFSTIHGTCQSTKYDICLVVIDGLLYSMFPSNT